MLTESEVLSILESALYQQIDKRALDAELTNLVSDAAAVLLTLGDGSKFIVSVVQIEE